MKKLLLTLGTLGSITAPIVAVVSCGNKKETPKPAQAAHPAVDTTSTGGASSTGGSTQTPAQTQAPVSTEVRVSTEVELAKAFGKAFLANENNLIGPIHNDSMVDFINNIIPLWTKVQKDGHVANPTFADNYVFSNTGATNNVEATAGKITPVLQNLVKGFLPEAMSAITNPLVARAINNDLIKDFISQEHLSVGIAKLVKGLLDPVVHAAQGLLPADSLAGLVNGIIPFAKKEVVSTDITASISKSGLLEFFYKDSKTLGGLLSSVGDISSGMSEASDEPEVSPEDTATQPGAQAAPAQSVQHTVPAGPALGMGSVMKILTDKATIGILSSLMEYLTTTEYTRDALNAIATNWGNGITHVDPANPQNSDIELHKFISSGILFGGKTAKKGGGKQTKGMIDWYVSRSGNNLTFTNEEGDLLATAVETNRALNFTFKVAELPLKPGLVSSHIINPSDTVASVNSISIKELASECYVNDLANLASMALGMIVAPFTQYVHKNEVNNPLTIDLDTRVAAAQAIEAGSTIPEDAKALSWLLPAKEAQKTLLTQLKANNITPEQFLRLFDLMTKKMTFIQANGVQEADMAATIATYSSKTFGTVSFADLYAEYKTLTEDQQRTKLQGLVQNMDSDAMKALAGEWKTFTDLMAQQEIINELNTPENLRIAGIVMAGADSGTPSQILTAYQTLMAKLNEAKDWYPAGFSDIMQAISNAYLQAH